MQDYSGIKIIELLNSAGSVKMKLISLQLIVVCTLAASVVGDRDVPNPPLITGLTCNGFDAVVTWKPQGDNDSPILYYDIQYNTAFQPNTWITAVNRIQASDFHYTISISPWTNYTYRVIAFNQVGPSMPSEVSSPCQTQQDVPYGNPENVKMKSKSGNLIIQWTPMPQIEHNGSEFNYRVWWKPDVDGAAWNVVEIYNWERYELIIPDQPLNKPFLFKVQAANSRGWSNLSARTFKGHSR